MLDVFTTEKLQGNPLAVVLDSHGIATGMMQAIAREMNLSETTFIQRRDPTTEKRNGVRVRIFTTEEELPFAGHPTLGTASLLRAIAPECIDNEMENETVRLALNVGTIPVRFTNSKQQEPWPARGEMTQRDPEFGEVLDPDVVASLTGLSVSDFDPHHPVQIVSTGTAFAIVPLRSAASLAKLKVRQDEATAYLRARGARCFYVLAPEPVNPSDEADAMPLWRARMQFNGGEDPATGSAAGCAISYLVGKGIVDSRQTIHVRQGVEISRPSDLYLSAKRNLDTSNETKNSSVTDVRVGGSTIPVASGHLFLP
ncbi:PhzF family phenazine biosynthesis protein [Acidicapsa dinghuensis]|uniref:PhzF family phenazine biosynthesis protein n=1 Tax=Acidicapsa dinghuensis TaxID=2218256 RepID=A0ABW1EDD0_9BACT|nr:PhzF family phenazine biosynthesis protein [Acidicapsa dinghuensis]